MRLRRLSIFILALALLSMVHTQPAHAASLVVSNLHDSGPGSLRQAMLDAQASPGADLITFGAGGTGIIKITSGDLPGTTQPLEVRGPSPAAVTIQLACSNSASCAGFFCSNCGMLQMSDLLITGSFGEAIYVYGAASLKLSTVTLTGDNGAVDSPLRFHGENAWLDNLRIDQSVGGVHGAIEIDSTGTVTINNATLTRNQTGLRGGGIHISNGAISINNSVIDSNTAAAGGGIYAEGGSLSINNSTINRNAAIAGSYPANSGEGGGIYAAVPLTITNSTLTNNYAENGSGILAISGFQTQNAAVQITNSTIANNSASSRGGGLYAALPTSIVNTTFYNNHATAVGIPGGGNLAPSNTQLTLKNSIIAGGGAANDCSFVTTPINSLGHNIVSDATCALTGPGDLNSTNPQLGALALNGGTTMTNAPLTGSPAIDGGDNSGCPALDQRAAARPQDGDGNGSVVCDIGAYEVVHASAPYWQNLGPGAGIDIGAAPDGLGWVIGTDNNVYHWDGTAWLIDGVSPGSPGARISIGPDGLPWVVSLTGEILRREATGWVRLPGAARDIGVGADSSTWVIGTDGGIYHWNNSAWEQVSGGASNVAVGPDGQPWVVNSAGQIYHRIGADWQQLPGGAFDIGVGADGSVWVVGVDNGIYRWTGSTWVQVAGSAARISVGPAGRAWLVNNGSLIYTITQPVTPTPPSPITAAPPPRSSKG